MVHMRWSGVFWALLVVGSGVVAQDAPKAGVLLGAEKRVRDEIEVAGRLADEGRIEEALRRYQQLLAESGDVLINVGTSDPRHFVPARWLIHRRIAALSPDARRMYRQLVEPRAKQWLEQGQAQRDVRLFEQVVAEAFCSASAEAALDRLGDLALERADFELAEHYWLMLSDYPAPRTEAGAASEQHRLRFPDPQIPEALIQAKLILSLIFRGEGTAAKKQLEAFRRKHPEAQGYLAGRTGRLADIVQSLLDGDSQFSRHASTVSGWLTFGGNPTRGRVITRSVVPYWPDVPTWRASLPSEQLPRAHQESDPPLGTGAAARSLAFHPVIIPGFVLVADAARVFVYHLDDGRLADLYDHRIHAGLPTSLDLRIPSRTDVVYTLTADGDRIYARFGSQAMVPPESVDRPGESESVIACLELRRLGDKKVRLVPRWQLRARLLDTDPPALFEGAPLVHEGRLYVARTRFEGRQMVTAIECYDADSIDPREPPVRRWRQEIWSVDRGHDPPRRRHDLLTLAGGAVVYCTHSGAIVALDARTGQRAWAFRYKVAPPRSMDGLLPRDLAPCLYAEGRIYAAPADSDRLYCLDARTGEWLWDSGPTYAIQLLGVCRGRLFVTLGGFPQGLRAYDAARGTVLWTKPDDGDRATFGRGLLSEQFVFWPTRLGLRVLHQDDGEPADARSSAEPWGHLAMSDGYLVVTTPTEVWGFVPPRARLGALEREAAAHPNDPVRLYEWAIALADAGQLPKALAVLDQADSCTGPENRRFGHTLKMLIDRRRRELWEVTIMSTVGDHLSAGDFEMGVRPLALVQTMSDRLRLWNLSRSLGIHALLNGTSVSDWRRIWLDRIDGPPVRADCWLVQQLDTTGRAEWDRRGSQDGTLSGGTARALPASRALQDQWLQQAQAREKEEPQQAAATYRALIEALAPKNSAAFLDKIPEVRQAALEGLIRVYDAGDDEQAARALRLRIGQEKGESPPTAVAPRGKSRLPEWPVPWSSDGGLQLGEVRWLPPMLDGFQGGELSRSESHDRVFFCADDEVQCRLISSGTMLWKQRLRHGSEEFAILGDSVIVAGRDGISRLRQRDGRLIWEFCNPAKEAWNSGRRREPFRRLEPWPVEAPLSQFLFTGPRVICRRGEEYLLAVDTETGLPEWQFHVPGALWRSPEEGAGIGENFLATPDYVLLQTTGGELLGLDARQGRLLYRKAAPQPWHGPPVLGDVSWAVFAEGPTLRAIDLADGKERWNFTPRGVPSLTGAAPLLRREGRHLFGIWERNYGYELVAVNLDNGQELYPPVPISSEPVSWSTSAVTEKVCVLVGESTAVGIHRELGRRLWEIALPGPGRWRAVACRNVILLYSDPPTMQPDLDFRNGTVASARLLTLAGWQEFTNRVAWSLRQRVLSVHAIDPDSGRTRHAQAFSADVPQAVVLHRDDTAVIVSGSQWFRVSRR